MSSELVDKFARTISYLRLSLTDRCNLSCQYCQPCETSKTEIDQQYSYIDAKELLSYEELLRIVEVGVGLGLKKIRLTGGEPLVRRGVMDFIREMSSIDDLEQIRLTTNGVLLAEKCEKLFELGIHHLNISLDSLDAAKFARITGKDYLNRVETGIDKALGIGFRIKLNVVAMKGFNDDEFLNFAKLALQKPLQVRFIEFMPVGKGSPWEKNRYVSGEDIQKTLSSHYSLEPLAHSRFEGPARMFTIADAEGNKGKIGFISPISQHFCDQCNRLRLTSEGKLRSCLLHDGESDLKALLRNGGTDQDIRDMFRQVILLKPRGHDLGTQGDEKGRPACQVRMSRIGG